MATVPNGQRTYSGTSTGPITFADRYQYVTVTNLNTTAGDVLYVTSDGSTPSTSGASNTQAIMPGETAIIANEQPLWFQSSRVLVQGSDNANAQSKAGRAFQGLADDNNPGVVLNFAGTSPNYIIEAAG